jgi:hypothetical protein
MSLLNSPASPTSPRLVASQPMAYLFIEGNEASLNAALVSDTIFLFANKLVQIAICPTHYHLHGFVKCPDGRVTRNQDASPNCWLNVSQNYLRLIHSQRHLA